MSAWVIVMDSVSVIYLVSMIGRDPLLIFALKRVIEAAEEIEKRVVAGELAKQDSSVWIACVMLGSIQPLTEIALGKPWDFSQEPTSESKRFLQQLEDNPETHPFFVPLLLAADVATSLRQWWNPLKTLRAAVMCAGLVLLRQQDGGYRFLARDVVKETEQKLRFDFATC